MGSGCMGIKTKLLPTMSWRMEVVLMLFWTKLEGNEKGEMKKGEMKKRKKGK